jgi:hypothetical protein
MRAIRVAPQTALETCDGCSRWPSSPAAIVLYQQHPAKVHTHVNLCLDCAAFVRMALGHQIDSQVGSPAGGAEKP